MSDTQIPKQQLPPGERGQVPSSRAGTPHYAHKGEKQAGGQYAGPCQRLSSERSWSFRQSLPCQKTLRAAPAASSLALAVSSRYVENPLLTAYAHHTSVAIVPVWSGEPGRPDGQRQSFLRVWTWCGQWVVWPQLMTLNGVLRESLSSGFHLDLRTVSRTKPHLGTALTPNVC